MRLRTLAIGFVLLAAMIGVSSLPADAANAVCPSLCLTGGGVVGKGGMSVAVSNVNTLDGVHAAGIGMESRTYNFDWIVPDSTSDGLPITIAIQINVAGHGGSSTFTGEGSACMVGPNGHTVCVDVNLTDDGTLVTASGGGFDLSAALGELGVATYQSSSDPRWSASGDGDCDGHSNETGIGHVLGRGNGHDCDGG